MMFTEKLQRLRVPVVAAPDGGTEEGDWDDATPVDCWGTTLEAVSSTEDLIAQRLVKSTHKINADPYDADGSPADWQAADRLVYGGATYEIEGKPQRWQNRRGRLHHWKLFVYEIEG